MELAHEDANRLSKEIREVVGRYLDLQKYRLFYFGSRVTGTASERSDIDVGIYGDQPVSGAVLTRIREDFDDLRTLYLVEVVDFQRVAPQFREIALRTTEPIL